MKLFSSAPGLIAGLSLSFLSAQELTNLPPDPFGDIEVAETAPDYAVEVDRNRGAFTLDAEDGEYVPGDHFAHWHWKAKPGRWGKFYVGLNYISNRTKLGVQVKFGDLAPVKSYAPRTGRERVGNMILGTVYIPKNEEYQVTLLTGDQSNVPDFMVKGLEFTPAPEGETLGQSIDGTINLHAKSATTFAEKMRFEPNEEKNCLGFWTSEKDWAEWEFDVSSPGEFEVKVVHGCGEGNGGSDVNVLINDKTLSFKVEETGGFQNWKEVSIGKVKFDIPGRHKLAIMPVNKAGKAVMDVQKLVLTPAGS
ncbi:MAG: hypothetical protein P1U89_02430 [Verrucomicrobiales bacterium]|nr:hypothetical protein [Verrucomicrobiales bacterium]